MRYIYREFDEGIEFDRYLNALEAYRHLLPAEVASFASDESRFTLDHASSLHDAWLESIVISESRASGIHPSEVTIEIILLGQQHDRKIHLKYSGVSQYSSTLVKSDLPSFDTKHGDLFTHEVRYEDAHVVHEILFQIGTRMLISCNTFTVEEVLMN